MKSVVVAVLFTAVCLTSGVRATTAGLDPANNGSLQAQLKQLLAQNAQESGAADVRSAQDKLKYALDPIEAVKIGLGIAENVKLLGLFELPAEIAGPLAVEAMVIVEIAGAHAEAINSLLNDQTLSGFSRGVVLGADRRSASYVKSNFVKFGPVPNSVYPEYGKKFQNTYNRALIAGYAQGKALSDAERKAFFLDLFSRMTVKPADEYGEDSKLWSDRTWVDYYVETAAVFRSNHLKE